MQRLRTSTAKRIRCRNRRGRHDCSSPFSGRSWPPADPGHLAFLEPILQNFDVHGEIAPFVGAAFMDDACYRVVGIKERPAGQFPDSASRSMMRSRLRRRPTSDRFCNTSVSRRGRRWFRRRRLGGRPQLGWRPPPSYREVVVIRHPRPPTPAPGRAQRTSRKIAPRASA